MVSDRAPWSRAGGNSSGGRDAPLKRDELMARPPTASRTKPPAPPTACPRLGPPPLPPPPPGRGPPPPWKPWRARCATNFCASSAKD